MLGWPYNFHENTGHFRILKLTRVAVIKYGIWNQIRTRIFEMGEGVPSYFIFGKVI